MDKCRLCDRKDDLWLVWEGHSSTGKDEYYCPDHREEEREEVLHAFGSVMAQEA